jgi:hypothetical protein
VINLSFASSKSVVVTSCLPVRSFCGLSQKAHHEYMRESLHLARALHYVLLCGFVEQQSSFKVYRLRSDRLQCSDSACSGTGVEDHRVPLVDCQQVLPAGKNWLRSIGDVASSQVSPVRAAQQPRSGRLDGSSGVVDTPAKAGDALAASAPCDSLLPWSDLQELRRQASWDLGEYDDEGVPC